MWPSQSWTTTRLVYWRATPTVSSVLWESTTTISSAQDTEARAAPRSAASFLATTVTESFGTRGVYLRSGRASGSGRAGKELTRRSNRGGRRDRKENVLLRALCGVRGFF